MTIIFQSFNIWSKMKIFTKKNTITLHFAITLQRKNYFFSVKIWEIAPHGIVQKRAEAIFDISSGS